MVKPKNCNIVQVRYDKKENAVEEIRIKSKVTYAFAEKKVKENKLPIYFYVIGSWNTNKPVEIRNKKCQSEYSKIID